MANPQIVDYIKENLSKGFSLDQIKEGLVKAGYPESDINEAVSFSQQGQALGQELAPVKEVPTKKISKKLWMIIVFVVVAISSVGFILVIVLSPGEERGLGYLEGTGEKTGEETQKVEEEPEQTILDCYNEDFTETTCDANYVLSFTDTFEENLKLCKPSTGTFALGWEPIAGWFRGYEILGEEENLCVIKFWFLENKKISSELTGKEMACKYSESQRSNEEVANNMGVCSGPLKDAIIEFQNKLTP